MDSTAETRNRSVEHRPPQAGAVEPACPCGSRRTLDLGRCRATSHAGSASAADDPGRLYRCRECELVFRSPAISPGAAEALYESIAGDDWQYADNDCTAWKLALERLRRRAPGSLLDIGSFDGQFLAQTPPGWQRAAIEPNPAAVGRLRQMGIDAIQGSLTEDVCDRLRGQFDIVTMFDVFEHLHDPLRGLECACACLRPGGELWLSTGNADHWTWKLLGSEHPYLATVQHLVIGSESWFRRTCRRQGWSSLRLTRISHRAARGRSRAHAAALAVYFGSRRRPWPYRGAAHVMHRLPGARQWLHKHYMPHISQLRDHLFVEIRP